VVLAGTSPGGNTKTIDAWAQGNVYKGSHPHGIYTQGSIPPPYKAASLLDSEGHIVSRGHPQYEHYDVSDFVSVRDHGAVGDGVTDDTKALQVILDQVCFNSFSAQQLHDVQLYCHSTRTARSYFLTRASTSFLPR